MITVNGQVYELSDPLVIGIIVTAVLVLLLFVLLITGIRRAGRSAAMTA